MIKYECSSFQTARKNMGSRAHFPAKKILKIEPYLNFVRKNSAAKDAKYFANLVLH